MESQAKKFNYKVGAFIALGLVAIMLSVLAVGGNKMFLTKYVHYSTEFSEVTGLFAGSVISLQGLPIGNVEKIDFSSKANKLSVFLAVDSRYADRIKKGTTAEIRTQGALGDKYIFLNAGDPTAETIASGSAIPTEETGDILKMLTDKDQGVGQVLDLIKELRVLVASVNADGRPAKLMKNFNESASEMRTTLASLDSLIKDLHNQIPKDRKLNQAVTDLASILEKIDKGQGSLGALVNDPSIHQSLKNLLGGSQRQSYIKNVLRETVQKSKD